MYWPHAHTQPVPCLAGICLCMHMPVQAYAFACAGMHVHAAAQMMPPAAIAC